MSLLIKKERYTEMLINHSGVSKESVEIME